MANLSTEFGDAKGMTSKIVWMTAAVVIAVLVIAAFVYYNSPAPSPISGQLQTPTDQADLNWGGYSVANNFSSPKPVVTGVSGSWTVPQVKVSQNDTFSAIWVGIGGFFGHTLIQTGTEQDSINGTVYYSAWYELLPSDSVTITTIEVSAGDTMKASINLVNSALNMWSIEVTDLSNGQSFSQDVFYDSSRLSAEWIVERPDVDNVVSEIADFGSITISNCTAVVNNQVGAFGYFPSVRLFMYNTEGTRLANVSNYNDGSSFTVTYLTSQ